MIDYPASDQWHTRALNATPGASQTRSKQRSVFGDHFPAAIAQANGCKVLTVDGQWLTDWNGALGAVTLGYSHPVVNDAIRRQLTQGTLYSLPSVLEVDVSEQLCEFLKWPESVRWVKTGSEATEAAVRIARCATGRGKILSIGYHGWHSQWLGALPTIPNQGIPDDLSRFVERVPWEYPGISFMDDFADCMDRGRFAAVIVETQWPIPEGTLQKIRTWCTDTGTLLICDEVFQGLRLHRNGWHGLEDVEPDLACFGKALGNGIPVACVVGKRDLMQHAVWASGTFSGDCLGLAAASAVMKIYDSERICDRVWDTGALLKAGIADAERDYGFHVEGWAPHQRIIFYDDSEQTKINAYVQGMAHRGHLVHPSAINIMTAHTQEDVKSFCTATMDYLKCANGK